MDDGKWRTRRAGIDALASGAGTNGMPPVAAALVLGLLGCTSPGKVRTPSRRAPVRHSRQAPNEGKSRQGASTSRHLCDMATLQPQILHRPLQYYRLRANHRRTGPLAVATEFFCSCSQHEQSSPAHSPAQYSADAGGTHRPFLTDPCHFARPSDDPPVPAASSPLGMPPSGPSGPSPLAPPDLTSRVHLQRPKIPMGRHPQTVSP